jgi:hypothetical protein
VVIRQTAAQIMAAEETGVVYPFTDYSATLKITPNPVSSEMVIQHGNMGDYFDVKIYDVNGGIVLTAPRIVSGQHISIANLRTGVYFVRINTGKETITKKLIKR